VATLPPHVQPRKGNEDSRKGRIRGKGKMADHALSSPNAGSSSGTSLIYDPKVRGIFYQVVTVALLVLFVWTVTNNTIHNLQKANIT
jgi:hypothetical protein